LRAPDVLRRIFQLTLHDLNNRRLLLKVYSIEELDGYIERLVEAIAERRAVRDLPVLEEWDSRYGVGKRYGVGIAEVGPVATAAAAVEVALWATVFIGVGGDSVIRIQEQALASAVQGDAAAMRTLATAGALIRLAGEVLVHANNFE
jgi:hypothetical protein